LHFCGTASTPEMESDCIFSVRLQHGYAVRLASLAPESPCPHSVRGLLMGLARAAGTWLHAPDTFSENAV
ncbi:MAG: hypothetical protein REJ50_21740, partial [Bordetella sp.]|nr:hypothetical protein [Bordetella sp.]